MLVSMRDMLNHASDNNYAVMAINCINMEILKAILGAAEEEASPVIVNISPRQIRAHADLNYMVPMIIKNAERVSVPVAFNLDHGQEYKDIVKALQLGFSSVMYDGSTQSFDDNVKNTRLIASLAHAKGCSVEAELGHVGSAQMGDGINEDFYTNVDLAVDFVKKTDIDCLAVAIGTAHGKYPEGFVPELDFERLKELKMALKMPLVLHGGSGAGEENIKKAVSLGINKINVCTDLFNYGRDAIASKLASEPGIDYMDLQHHGELAMKSYIKNYMKLIGSSNQSKYDLESVKEFD